MRHDDGVVDPTDRRGILGRRCFIHEDPVGAPFPVRLLLVGGDRTGEEVIRLLLGDEPARAEPVLPARVHGHLDDELPVGPTFAD